MAVILTEGFDMYNGVGAVTSSASTVQTRWTSQGSATAAFITGRFGGQALRITGASTVNRYFTTTVGAQNYSSFAFGMGVLIGAYGSAASNNTANILFLEAGGVTQVGLAFNSVGGVVAGRYTTTTALTVLGTSLAGVFPIGQWIYLEGEIVISDTVGRITLWADGTQILDLTNIDTRNGTPTDVGIILIGNTQSIGTPSAIQIAFDDIYFTDSDVKLGECRVETLRPGADNSVTWARSAGSTNFSLVNESLADSDTTYVTSANSGDRDLYDLDNLGSTPSIIHCVNAVSIARKTDAATVSVKNTLKSGGVDSLGSDYALGATYSRKDRIVLLNPDGSVAWTAAAVNALLAGPQLSV